MSRFFPHSDYAEEQPFAKTILSAHVLYRGFQSGAVVGAATGAVRTVIDTARSSRAPVNTSAVEKVTQSVTAEGGAVPARSAMHQAARTAKIAAPSAATTILRSTSMGALVGTGLMVVALPGRMWGREDIEWKDRSWRLLENKGQLEVDNFTAISTIGGAVLVAVSRASPQVSGFRRTLGGAGLGSVVGVAGYMLWRYGVHGGKH